MDRWENFQFFDNFWILNKISDFRKNFTSVFKNVRFLKKKNWILEKNSDFGKFVVKFLIIGKILEKFLIIWKISKFWKYLVFGGIFWIVGIISDFWGKKGFWGKNWLLDIFFWGRGVIPFSINTSIGRWILKSCS